jgi:hypothetical protein
VQQFAPLPGSGGSITRIRGRRALGEEASLRAVIESGERLLVCASVRFADRPVSQPLWLTDRRFIFTRAHSGYGKLVVSVPIVGCALDYENAAPYPLHLSWTDDDGVPCRESFRWRTWQDGLSSGSAGATGGATGGIEGAIIGAAVDAAINAAAPNHRAASLDQRLYSTLTAALQAPSTVRPVDLTADSLNTLGSRLLIGIWMSIITAVLLAVAIFAFVSYTAKQAYEAAPLCRSATGSECRMHQGAVVTDYRGAHDSYETMYCDLSMSTADGSSVTVRLLAFNLCRGTPKGQEMTLESWRGSVVAVIAPGVRDPQETEKNPEYNGRAGAILTGVSSLLWLLFGSVSLAELIGWHKRRSLLRASAQTAAY